ncbi:hypothetical protein [Desulfurobacterium crinifex]
MVKYRILILVISFFLIYVYPVNGKAVCIVDSYRIEATSYVRSLIEKELNNFVVFSNVSLDREKIESCDPLILLGTPVVVEAIKKIKNKKVIYTFVMFPEILGLHKKKNFFGIRIIPLPDKTAEVFFSYTGFEKRKIAVPVSRGTQKIAKKYLSNSKLFKILPFDGDISRLKSRLSKYEYIYIFPDPEVLEVVNLLKLMKFAKENEKIVITSLPDLDRYGVNFIYAVDYNMLAEKINFLIKNTPEEKILSCPARVKLWNP